MNIGKNIQYLRKQKKVTQEDFAEKMQVSRQTVSKWESDEVTPELSKLVEMSRYFACSLDALVKNDMAAADEIYSSVRFETVPAFKMARYVMITPNCEDDVNRFMDDWAEKEGLTGTGHDAKKIGWDFPFVTPELQNRFGLRGYVAAYILPDDFVPKCPCVEIASQKEADYAVISVRDPFAAAFERIPNAYKIIIKYLESNGFKERQDSEILSCFEHVYEKKGVTYMDVFIHADGVSKADIFTAFNT